MKYIYGLLLLCSIVFWGSCRNDFETEPSNGKLTFSRDTVYLDTVFSNIGSSTYKLTVYNRGNDDLSIPTISLGEGEQSNYRLNVDGVPGKTFQDVNVLAKDSIFVFIETSADIQEFTNNTQFLYTDALQFDSGANQQNVELVTLVQDAIFLYPEKFDDGSLEQLSFGFDEDTGEEITIDGFVLNDSELTFTNDKPYVIYGYAAVPSGKTLTVNPGARVYFHRESGIIVSESASLHVDGEVSNDPEALENEVIFESDRLEPDFSDIPGQWGSLWLTEGSTDNRFNHATIKNASIGIRMDSNDGGSEPTLSVRNTQIYNSAFVGLLARTGNVLGENIVINNSGQASLDLSLGGSYTFINCTFANYWNNSFRQFPSVLVENVFETQETLFVADLTQANFFNCIIYGNENLEMLFNKSEDAAFNYKFENCLIRFNDYNSLYAEVPEYNFEDTALFENIIINEEPEFFKPYENKLMINEESPANGAANANSATATDVLGKPRGSSPDLGAYESSPFPEDNE